MNKNDLPNSLANLLLKEGQRWKSGGVLNEALGTGIIPIVGSARSGKTSMAYVLIEYVIRNTNRPVILDSFPDIVIEKGIPKHWVGRVSNEMFSNLAEIDEPAVWLLDDNAVHYNSRDSMTSSSKLLARAAGVLSHFGGGMTVIFTTQLLSGIDLSFLRFTTVAPVIRFIDTDVIHQERKEWIHTVKEAQYQLKSVSKDLRFRDFYWVSKDRTLAKTYFPDFLDKKKDPQVADYLSRPMRYHSKKDRVRMISGESKTKKGAKNE